MKGANDFSQDSPAVGIPAGGVEQHDVGQRGGGVACAAPATAVRKILTEEEAEAHLLALIEKAPPGFRDLYHLLWFIRSAPLCSTAIRLRAMLISLFGSQVKVDLADVQYFDRGVRTHLCGVLLHLGTGQGFYDYHIRDAVKQFGLFHWWAEGFPKKSRPSPDGF